MSCDFFNWDMFGNRRNHRLRLGRSAGANGVTQTDFITSHVIKRLGNLSDFFRCNVAFIRAAKNTGYITTYRKTRIAGGNNQRTETIQTLGNRTIDILLRETFRCSTKNGDLGRARGNGGLKPLGIWGQNGIGHAGFTGDLCHDLGRIGHLRNPFRADKGGGLDHRQSRIIQTVYQFDLSGGRNHRLFVLKAIARADFNDFNVGG